jgi:four helix bundle protein
MEEGTEGLRVLVKWHDAAIYIYIMLRQIARSERYTIGAQIRACTVICGAYIEQANNIRSRNLRVQTIQKADLELCQLKLLVRLAFDLELIDKQKREQSVRLLAELGRFLGAWLKSYTMQAG